MEELNKELENFNWFSKDVEEIKGMLNKVEEMLDEVEDTDLENYLEELKDMKKYAEEYEEDEKWDTVDNYIEMERLGEI